MELYRGTRLSVEQIGVRMPDGQERDRIVVHPGNAVAVLPLRADMSCYLIRQYRYAIGEYIIEAPAGTINPGEMPEETAYRELIEETGFSAGILIPRGFLYTTPGFTDERIYLFEAHDLSPSCRYQKDEDEEIEVMRVASDDLPLMIQDGRISDAKTIALVYRCLGPGNVSW
jgi:ADP-ribose pyrophosphatase